MDAKQDSESEDEVVCIAKRIHKIGHDAQSDLSDPSKPYPMESQQHIEKVLADGVRTADLLAEEGVQPVSTSEMGDTIVAALNDSL